MPEPLGGMLLPPGRPEPLGGGPLWLCEPGLWEELGLPERWLWEPGGCELELGEEGLGRLLGLGRLGLGMEGEEGVEGGVGGTGILLDEQAASPRTPAASSNRAVRRDVQFMSWAPLPGTEAMSARTHPGRRAPPGPAC